MAITFDPVPLVDWVTCTPWYARIEPGQTLPVNVEVDASSLSIGVRAAVVHLYSNDRSATESLVTVTATVKDVSGVSETVPGRTAFIGAVPNPFNPKTRITFSLARSGPVQLDVHDVRGRRIRRLTTGDLSAGEHTVVWDGTDDSGRGQAAGVYFVRLQAQGGALTHKVTLVK
jgi:Tol biopolymer transport system component